MRNRVKTASESKPQPQLFAGLTPIRLGILMLGLCFGIILLRVFALSAFQVPSASMVPTILPGDFVVVNKVPLQWYRLFSSSRDAASSVECALSKGQVVAFWLPRISGNTADADREVFVKRIVATPGDTFFLRQQGCLLGMEARQCSDSTKTVLMPSLERRVPYAGQLIPLSSENISLWRSLIEAEGNSVHLRHNIVYINANAAADYRLRRNYYVVLGDNRADSYDSRYFGYVSEDDMIGLATMVYWSSESDTLGQHSTVRWNRIGHILH